jgi:hypothetical protein
MKPSIDDDREQPSVIQISTEAIRAHKDSPILGLWDNDSFNENRSTIVESSCTPKLHELPRVRSFQEAKRKREERKKQVRRPNERR